MKNKIKFSLYSIGIFILFALIFESAHSGGISEPPMIIYGKIFSGNILINDGKIEISIMSVSGGEMVSVSREIYSFKNSIKDTDIYSYKVKIPVEYLTNDMTVSENSLQLSEQELKYIRTIKITADNTVKIYTDNIFIKPLGQKGYVERRDFNIKFYSPEEIQAVLLGYSPNIEKIDMNGDQKTDIGDLIQSVQEMAK